MLVSLFPVETNAWIRLGCTDIDQSFKCIYLHTRQYHLSALHLNVQIIVSSTTLSFLVELCEQKKKKKLFKGEALWPYQCSLKLNSCKILCPLFPSLNKNFQNKLQKMNKFYNKRYLFRSNIQSAEAKVSIIFVTNKNYSSW